MTLRVPDVCQMMPEKWYGKMHSFPTTFRSGTAVCRTAPRGLRCLCRQQSLWEYRELLQRGLWRFQPLSKSLNTPRGVINLQ